MAVRGLAVGQGRALPLGWRGLLVLRALGVGAAAGFVAGFVAGGIGSRLAMKVVALVAGPGARGRLTENGNAIGDFTAGGTLFLLLFGATLGMTGGLVYVALRPWLAAAGRWRGLACGAVLLATIRAGTIDARNIDFTHFGVPALNVALFAALPLAFGLLVAPLADGLDRRVPTPTRARVAGLGGAGGPGLVLLAILAAALLPGLLIGIAAAPARIGLALLLVATIAGCVALGARLFPAGEGRRFLRLGGYLLTLAAGVLGALFFLLLFVGVALNREERGETRLSAVALLLLLAGGLIGRWWVERDGGGARQRLTGALLALPVLVGLGVTLREIGLILLAA